MKGLVVAAIALCVGLIGLGVFFATRETATQPRILPMNEQYERRLSYGGWVKGQTDDPLVVIEEYGDYQCPGCAGLHPVISAAIRETAEYTQFIYRNYPLPSHNKARLAAEIAESAGRQGKYWETQDYLYGTQQDWTNMTTSQFRDYMITYVQSLGLNVEQFRADLRDSSIGSEINKDVIKGNAIPLRQTPTLVVNGELVQSIPNTEEAMIAFIQSVRDQELARRGQAPASPAAE